MASEKFDNNQRRRGEGLSRGEWTHLVKQAGFDAAKVASRGIGLRILLNILTGLRRTITDKHPFNTKLWSFLFGKSVRRTGALLGGFVFTYKVLLETLPRYTNLSDKQSDFIAGALSGLWILVESASVRTVYGVGIASRAIQGLLKSANNNQKFNVPKGTDVLFSLSAAQIFFSFIAHPLAFAPATMMNMLDKTGVSYSTIRNNLDIIRGKSLEKYSFIHSHLLNTIDPNNLARLYALREQPNLIPCASIHPSQTSCLVNIFVSIVKGIKRNLAFYFAMNLVPGAMFKRKAFLSDPLPRIKDAIKSTLKSSFALGLFILLLQGQLCGTRNFFGNVRFLGHRYIYFFQALIAAFVAIQFETTGRKKELTLIFTTQAIETLYKVLRLKGVLPRVPHFESVLFALGAGVFLTLIRHEPKSLDSIDHKIATKILRLNSIHDPEPNTLSFFDENDDEDEVPPKYQSKSTYNAPSTSERNLADSQHSVGSSNSEKFESIGERDLASSQDSVSQPQDKQTSKKGKKKNKQNQQSEEPKDLSESVQSLD